MDVPNKGNTACRLLKAIYGLKQSGRAWWITLDSVLVQEFGFTSCISDTCVYVYTRGPSIIVVFLYVDDLVQIVLILNRKEQELL